ncbi:MAG: glycosyltransferase family 39 protein, partial [Acidimicrobiia bacterium]
MSTTDTAGGLGASRRFLVVLGLIVLAGFGLRVVYVLTVTNEEPTTRVYDATYYELQARAIAEGHGYVDPFLLQAEGRSLPAADHPPLTVFAIVPAAFIGDESTSRLAMRMTMVLFGTTTIALIGLLTRRLTYRWAGDAAGIVAAGIAALDPNLWMNDGLVMSEALSVLITVVLVALTYRVLRTGATWRTVLALGVVSGLGILARAEFVLYVPFLVVPALWVGARSNRPRAVALSAAACATALLVLAPWLAFNLSRFERPTFLSTNDGLSLAGANCDFTFSGSHLAWVTVFEPC